jgi:hypothetical protein
MFNRNLKRWLKEAERDRDYYSKLIERAANLLTTNDGHSFNYDRVAQYLDKLEADQKEFAEHAKIQQIILSLVKKSALKD